MIMRSAEEEKTTYLTVFMIDGLEFNFVRYYREKIQFQEITARYVKGYQKYRLLKMTRYVSAYQEILRRNL